MKKIEGLWPQIRLPCKLEQKPFGEILVTPLRIIKTQAEIDAGTRRRAGIKEDYR